MKNIFTIIFLLSSHSVLSQDPYDNLYSAKWSIGKSKIMFGYSVQRLEGQNDVYGVTNIAYQDSAMILSDLRKTAHNEMWDSAKIKKTFSSYIADASGGFIILYEKRLTIDAANTEWFTIIIQDTSGKEIYRKQLDKETPEVPSSGSSYWWNVSSISIGDVPTKPFYVYVIDAVHTGNPRFKFMVSGEVMAPTTNK